MIRTYKCRNNGVYKLFFLQSPLVQNTPLCCGCKGPFVSIVRRRNRGHASSLVSVEK